LTRVWLALSGRCRGGTSGRSRLSTAGSDSYTRAGTSRPGVRRGSPSKSGRCRPRSAAHSEHASLRATIVGLPGCSCSPRQRPGRDDPARSVKDRGLPQERGQLAGDGDRDDAGWLAALVVQALPALVKAGLCAPGDLDHARVLTALAACEHLADRCAVAVVMGGFGQQPAGVRRSCLGDRALPAACVRRALRRDDPEEPRQQRRPGEPAKAADLGAESGGRACRSRESSATVRSPGRGSSRARRRRVW
jgi:hypothetical protein